MLKGILSVVPIKLTMGFVALFPIVLHAVLVPDEVVEKVKLGAVPFKTNPLPAEYVAIVIELLPADKTLLLAPLKTNVG